MKAAARAIGAALTVLLIVSLVTRSNAAAGGAVAVSSANAPAPPKARAAAAPPDSSWRGRPARPVAFGDSTRWVSIADDHGPSHAAAGSRDSASALLAPAAAKDGVPLWRQHGSLRVNFELCRLSRLAVDDADSATAESCWTALSHRASPWRWIAVSSRAELALARGDTVEAESLIVRAGPRLQNALDQAEQQLALARLRAAKGDSLRALASLGTLFARWPSTPPAAAAIALFDSLSAPPRDSLAHLFARRTAEVEVLSGARLAAVRRLRSAFRPDTSVTRRAAALELGLRIAELLRLTRKFNEAYTLLDSLAPLAAPESRGADVMLARARALRDAGHSDDARREYARAAAAARDSATIESAWWESGREAEEQGAWNEARTAYAHVDSLRRSRANVAVMRSGLLSLAEGNRVLARASFARDTGMAGRFWWAMTVRDTDRALADSALAAIASTPGFRYYSVCARESLGTPAQATGMRAHSGRGTIELNRADRSPAISGTSGETLAFAHDLVLAGLLADAAFLIERWALGDEEAGAPAKNVRFRPKDLLDAAALENACGRPAPAIRLARRAADEIARVPASDSLSTLALAATAFQFPPAYAAEILQAAAVRHVAIDPDLLAALVWQESRFDSGAVSRTGARGLTQLMPPTAAEMARQLHERAPPESLLNDARVNLRYGARYLRTLLDRYAGRVPLALAAYNAGVPAADRWAKLARGADDALLCELIAYAETQDYVKSILAARVAYRELRPAFRGSSRTPIR